MSGGKKIKRKYQKNVKEKLRSSSISGGGGVGAGVSDGIGLYCGG
jgi:hypothetical protein